MMILGGYGFYNWLRFNDIFEFGVRYQHVGDPVQLARIQEYGPMSFIYIWRNLYHLLFLIPRIDLIPPYFHYYAPSWLVGDYPKLVAIDYCSSIIFASPLLLSIFGILKIKAQMDYIVMLILILIFATGPGLILLGYSHRYVQDYYPYIVILAFLGFMQFQFMQSRWARILIILALIWTALVAFNLNTQFFDPDFGKELIMRGLVSS